MHDHGPREDPLTDMGFETRDINVKGLRNTAIIFFGFSMACFVVVAVWFVWYAPKMSTSIDPTKHMPEVPLQSNISVREDIQVFRQAETKRLETRGGNPDGGLRIPITDAINIIAQRGLPRTESSVHAVSPGNTITQNATGPGTGGAVHG
jgi:hypothetical protein